MSIKDAVDLLFAARERSDYSAAEGLLAEVLERIGMSSCAP